MAPKLATLAATAIVLLGVSAGGPAGPGLTARATAAMPALHWTFDGGLEGWRAVFGPGQVRVTLLKEHVKIGAGAMEGTYTVAPHTYFAIARPLDVPDQPAITLSFWIKSMRAGQLGMYLTERDGSGYGYTVTLPVGQWKRFTRHRGSSYWTPAVRGTPMRTPASTLARSPGSRLPTSPAFSRTSTQRRPSTSTTFALALDR
ncbi:MAG: hypothetical protein ACT4PY_00905 [Armatimonadota bacterium]